MNRQQAVRACAVVAGVALVVALGFDVQDTPSVQEPDALRAEPSFREGLLGADALRAEAEARDRWRVRAEARAETEAPRAEVGERELRELVDARRAWAEEGDAAAQFALGRMYADGEGVPQNSAEAVRWFHRAAEQGGTHHQKLLAVWYESGNGPLSQNDAEAVRWYRRAAERGDTGAQMNLGRIYTNGHDLVEAARWYRRAAEQGDPSAQFVLGVRYASGEGVPLDYGEAYMWLNLAAGQLPDADLLAAALADSDVSSDLAWSRMVTTVSRIVTPGIDLLLWANFFYANYLCNQPCVQASYGNVFPTRDMAEAMRDAIAEQMTPAEISEAQRRAREWHATHLEP